MFDLENLDQFYGVQHSQYSHSMANINVCKSQNCFFLQALTAFQILAFQILTLKSRSRSQYTTSGTAPSANRAHHSTVTAVIAIHNDIAQNVDCMVELVFLSFWT